MHTVSNRIILGSGLLVGWVFVQDSAVLLIKRLVFSCQISANCSSQQNFALQAVVKQLTNNYMPIFLVFEAITLNACKGRNAWVLVWENSLWHEWQRTSVPFLSSASTSQVAVRKLLYLSFGWCVSAPTRQLNHLVHTAWKLDFVWFS